MKRFFLFFFYGIFLNSIFKLRTSSKLDGVKLKFNGTGLDSILLRSVEIVFPQSQSMEALANYTGEIVFPRVHDHGIGNCDPKHD
jgi:hypothetical protein